MRNFEFDISLIEMFGLPNFQIKNYSTMEQKAGFVQKKVEL
jgi:hypothetical protein